MSTQIPISEEKEQTESSAVRPAGRRISSRKDEISLLDILIALGQRKGFVLRVTVIFAVLASLISLLLPVRYTATVVLMPPQQASSMGAALASQLGNLGGMAALAGNGLGIRNPNEMFVAMFKTRTVEGAVVEHFNLMKEYRKSYLSDACKSFENHATVDGSGKDGLIRVSVIDSDSRRAAELANGYVDQFRKLSESLAITEASQRRLFFEHQLEQAKDNLANAENALKKTEQTTGLFELNGQARALIESGAALRAQIAAKEVQIQGMRAYATSENAQLVQAQQELDLMRAQMQRLGGSQEGSDGLMIPKGKVPEAGLEYVRRVRDVKYYETIFDILARQFEIAKLDEAKEGALIQVVDPALPPDKRSFPKRSLIVLGATALGFLLAVALALLQAGFGQLKDNPEASQKLVALGRAWSVRKHRGL